MASKYMEKTFGIKDVSKHMDRGPKSIYGLKALYLWPCIEQTPLKLFQNKQLVSETFFFTLLHFQEKIWLHSFAVADVKSSGKLNLQQFKFAVKAAQKCAKAKEARLLKAASGKEPENPDDQSTETE